MTGYRKLIMFVVAAAIAALAPLSSTQAGVMETLIIAAIGGNALEHVGGAIRDGVAARADRRSVGDYSRTDGPATK
jgi:hypothetical protein